MYVYFDVDERSLLRYMRQRRDRESAPGSLREEGVACYLQLADEQDFPHKGTLDFASSEVDAGTGTARIRGVFANADKALASGLFVRVRIPVGEPYQALMIPEQALATDQNQKFVYVVDAQNKVAYRPVKVGRLTDGLRIVQQGLQPGETVIVNGLQRVRPGVVVAPERVAMDARELAESKLAMAAK